MKDFTNASRIGSQVKQTFAFEISIKNNKNIPVNINIEDQVPISSDREIEVSLEESGGAKHDAATGFLKWRKKIQPNGLEKLKFRYTVKYPSGRKVNL
ncbi:MAG: hypothetical protein Kow0075_14270 [Salibacteraceae bacterium]